MKYNKSKTIKDAIILFICEVFITIPCFLICLYVFLKRFLIPILFMVIASGFLVYVESVGFVGKIKELVKRKNTTYHTGVITAVEYKDDFRKNSLFTRKRMKITTDINSTIYSDWAIGGLNDSFIGDSIDVYINDNNVNQFWVDGNSLDTSKLKFDTNEIEKIISKFDNSSYKRDK